MANIVDTIKQAQSSASLRPISQPADAYPKTSYLTTPVQGTWNILGWKPPDYGITETLRSLFNLPVSSVVGSSTNNPQVVQKVQQQDVQKRINETQKNFGVDYNTAIKLVTGTNPQESTQNRVQQISQQFTSGQSGVTNPNDVSTLKHERAMGANVGDIREFNGQKWRWNGEVWEQQSSPSNPPSPPSQEQIVNEVLDKAKGSGTGNLYNEDTMRKIIEDVYYKGMSVADAMDARGREVAEQRWRLINENLQRQKGELTTEAERQRQLAREQETLYKGQIEKRKGEELETITKQKEGSEKEVMQTKDELGRAFVDSSRKLQAVLRASGVSKSGFAIAQETELLRNFNRNLDSIAVKHKDLVDELDKAYRDTVSVYNDKIDNLEFETRKQISDVSAWERQQIVAIQNNENLNLADKLDRINDAINRADAVRMQVEQNYANQKLTWAQWTYEMQVKMALSAQAAAQNRIDNAYKQLQLIRQNYQDAINNAAFAKWQQTPAGEWSLMSPTYSGYVPIGTYSDEEKRRIEQKKMEQQVSPLNQWLSGLELGSGGSW